MQTTEINADPCGSGSTTLPGSSGEKNMPNLRKQIHKHGDPSDFYELPEKISLNQYCKNNYTGSGFRTPNCPNGFQTLFNKLCCESFSLKKAYSSRYLIPTQTKTNSLIMTHYKSTKSFKEKSQCSTIRKVNFCGKLLWTARRQIQNYFFSKLDLDL
jgi:hypothetical protein